MTRPQKCSNRFITALTQKYAAFERVAAAIRDTQMAEAAPAAPGTSAAPPDATTLA